MFLLYATNPEWGSTCLPQVGILRHIRSAWKITIKLRSVQPRMGFNILSHVRSAWKIEIKLRGLQPRMGLNKVIN